MTIPGNPVPQKRNRFVGGGRYPRVYNPSAPRLKEIRSILRTVWEDEPIDAPIELEVVFHMKIAKNISKRRRLLMEGQCHCQSSDIDNILKLYLDAMNNLIYVDDRQVWKLTASKVFSSDPRAEIKVMY